jgi:hypothetical protein
MYEVIAGEFTERRIEDRRSLASDTAVMGEEALGRPG